MYIVGKLFVAPIFSLGSECTYGFEHIYTRRCIHAFSVKFSEVFPSSYVCATVRCCWSIYCWQVTANGAAAKTGKLKTGDRILKVQTLSND